MEKFTLQVLCTKFLILLLNILFSFYQLVAICNWNWMPCPQLELCWIGGGTWVGAWEIQHGLICSGYIIENTNSHYSVGIWHNMMTYKFSGAVGMLFQFFMVPTVHVKWHWKWTVNNSLSVNVSICQIILYYCLYDVLIYQMVSCYL